MCRGVEYRVDWITLFFVNSCTRSNLATGNTICYSCKSCPILIAVVTVLQDFFMKSLVAVLNAVGALLLFFMGLLLQLSLVRLATTWYRRTCWCGWRWCCLCCTQCRSRSRRYLWSCWTLSCTPCQVVYPFWQEDPWWRWSCLCCGRCWVWESSSWSSWVHPWKVPPWVLGDKLDVLHDGKDPKWDECGLTVGL